MKCKPGDQRPVSIRFHERYMKSEYGCWIWQASGTSEGYGRIETGNKKKTLAHRLSYELHIGEIPIGMLVLHTCDTPACVNPAHLFLGTNATNTIDKVSKNRQARGPNHSKWSRGESHHLTRLTEMDVRNIRSDDRSQEIICEEYGVSQSTISSIKRGKSWKHVN